MSIRADVNGLRRHLGRDCYEASTVARACHWHRLWFALVGFNCGGDSLVTADDKALVPVWTLATEEVNVPNVTGGDAMTPERLAELRTVLATLADSPIATLEAHPVTAKRPRSGGISLHAASPLAQNLSLLMSQTAKPARARTDLVAAPRNRVLDHRGRLLTRRHPRRSAGARRAIHEGIACQLTHCQFHIFGPTFGATVSASECSRELTWHDDQTVPVQTEIQTYTFNSHPRGHGPRRTLSAVAIAARAAGALTATTRTAVAM